MSLSAVDFEQLQGQLLALKSDLYEARDRESRAIRAAEAAALREKEAAEKLSHTQIALQQAQQHQQQQQQTADVTVAAGAEDDSHAGAASASSSSSSDS